MINKTIDIISNCMLCVSCRDNGCYCPDCILCEAMKMPSEHGGCIECIICGEERTCCECDGCAACEV
jgi:hypothetical protein